MASLAYVSMMSPLAGTKHTYARLAIIIIHCQILAFFQVCFVLVDLICF